jgi:ABC-type polysaccharide/polyol phosphate transport system ATPase subunit
MVARLRFAIATDVQPDILILDEVLAVVDASFKQKKVVYPAALEQRETALRVPHDLEFMNEACIRSIWLQKGKVKFAETAS